MIDMKKASRFIREALIFMVRITGVEPAPDKFDESNDRSKYFYCFQSFLSSSY